MGTITIHLKTTIRHSISFLTIRIIEIVTIMLTLPSSNFRRRVAFTNFKVLAGKTLLHGRNSLGAERGTTLFAEEVGFVIALR